MTTDPEFAATAPTRRRSVWHACFGIAGTLTVYAALGLVTSVAVAWALAAWAPYRSGASVHLYTSGFAPGNNLVSSSSDIFGTLGGLRRDFSREDEISRRERLASSPGFVLPPLEFNRSREPLPAIALGGNSTWGIAARPLPPDVHREDAWEDARGLPFVCLWQSIRTDFQCQKAGVSLDNRIQGGIPLGHFGGTKHELTARGLPQRPIWRGLLANTAFYAICWFTVIRSSRLARRHRRITRGHCPRCGYDRESVFTTPCPECGWLPKRPALPRPQMPPVTGA